MGYCSRDPIKILNGDNFKHIISFFQTINGIRQPFSIDKINIKSTYYTEGSNKNFIATKTGDVISNCILDKDNCLIKIIFENYELDNGLVLCKLDLTLSDDEYPDGEQDSTKFFDIGIDLSSQEQINSQTNCFYNNIKIESQVKTNITVNSVSGNSSKYPITYNYIYSL